MIIIIIKQNLIFLSQINALDSYQVAAVATTSSSVDVILVDSDEPESDLENKVVYFVLPPSYLGNRLTSYGGFLNYTISFATRPFGEETTKNLKQKVIIIIIIVNTFYLFIYLIKF